ncbi:tetratricopeptide repeat protein [Halopseudomonas salegens]|uniref:Flp pilus assembly protein TadD, contains TPR repeats n=1 Tax=Halopseudomonas salegens TaxID=1434072 RepID=A0A1H2GMG7_9GAMM|nr:tetratricopeptide repeat protein [Halopseudomonas salegens]SDU20827.1 Flp pilus assembly protein TadD, contains TPR repeats [Halopseudomonas salegens]
MTPTLQRTLLVISLSLAVTACANRSQVESPETVLTEPQSEQSPVATPDIPPRPFPKDTLFELLAAEMAGQRNRFDLALGNYLRQAEQTRDPGVVERALRVAEFLGAQEPALEMATLWAQVAPNDVEAHRAAALQQARAGQIEPATASMRKVLAMSGEAHFDFLAAAASQSDSATRNNFLDTLQQLQQEYPDNRQLAFARALIVHEQEPQQALDILQQQPLIEQQAGALLLHANLLSQLDRPQEAIDLLHTSLQQHPDDNRLRLQLARLLLGNDELDAAAGQFGRLREQNPDDHDLTLTLGLISLENQQPDLAIDYLEQALEQQPDNGTTLYHLGLAQHELGQTEDAVQTWLAVRNGNEYLPARLRITQTLVADERLDLLSQILAESRSERPQERMQLYLLEIESLLDRYPERALEITQEALTEFNDDIDLLYIRSLLHDQLGQAQQSEQDLRHILSREPDNARAMNALGYTLANRNQRLDEALELIEQALTLKPDDPAILDSLGWVHYRLGNLERALEYLQQAWADFPDQEVAAHLGEVLWQLGRRDEARAIWDKSLDNDPDSPMVRETRQRLENE